MQCEDLQVARRRELLHDPVVVLAPHLSLVQVGLARVHPNDPDGTNVPHPASGPDQFLEVEVAHVAGIVVPRHHRKGCLDAVEIGDGDLVLLPVALVGQVTRADHQVGLQFVQLHDDAVHEVGDEEG